MTATGTPGVLVRAEEPRQFAAIARVVEAAFGKPDEARLVAELRETGGYIPALALVAETGAEVVGHVMFTHVTLRGDRDRAVLALAPVAVRPGEQRAGIGKALIREGLRIADELGEPLVVVLGHPAYYPKFGFSSARAMGVRPPSDEMPDAAFMALPLRAYDKSYRGTVIYPPAFGV